MCSRSRYCYLHPQPDNSMTNSHSNPDGKPHSSEVNPYEPAQVSSNDNHLLPRILSAYLFLSEFTSIMSVVCFLLASVFLIWFLICAGSIYEPILARRNTMPPSVLFVQWGVCCFAGAVVGFAASRYWWRRKIPPALVLTLCQGVMTFIIIQAGP